MKKSIIFVAVALLILAVSCGGGSQRSKNGVFVPDSLLIVPGQRVGDRVMDRKGDCYILCIKKEQYRTAENLGVGSTAKEVTEVFQHIRIDTRDSKGHLSVDDLPDNGGWGNATIYCFHPDGKDLGIEFRISIEEEKPDGPKREWKALEMWVYDTGYPKPDGAFELHSKADNPQEPPVLSPSKIGEFVRPSKEGDEEYGGPYGYTSDPNGQYYNFESAVTYVRYGWWALRWCDESFTATSSQAPTGNIRYDAQNLLNDAEDGGGNRAETWCEGVKGYGIGESVTMTFISKANSIIEDDFVCIDKLLIVNGYAKDKITWKNNSRVKTLRLYVGNRHWCDLHLADIDKPQTFQLPDGLEVFPRKHGIEIPAEGEYAKLVGREPEVKIHVYQTDFRFEIMEVYPGDKYDDTCITGIAIDVSSRPPGWEDE